MTHPLDTSKGAFAEALRQEALLKTIREGDPARAFTAREVEWWMKQAAALEADGL